MRDDKPFGVIPLKVRDHRGSDWYAAFSVWDELEKVGNIFDYPRLLHAD